MMLRFAQDMLAPIIKREADGNYFYVWPESSGNPTDPVGPFPTYDSARQRAMEERNIGGSLEYDNMLQPYERQDAFSS